MRNACFCKKAQERMERPVQKIRKKLKKPTKWWDNRNNFSCLFGDFYLKKSLKNTNKINTHSFLFFVKILFNDLFLFF
uniref:Uncharacterized protein n=1 Tax=Meloidogyne enterolobii TaxID=390850 RepID=A0A6V7WPR1_MELEN|nr:unnamed protein product [Meloidogyne enterolobii]